MDFLTSPAVGRLLAAAGGAIGPALVRVAHQRALAQPDDADLDAEARVLAGAIAHPQWMADADELAAEEFLDPTHASLWSLLQQRHADSPDMPWTDDELATAAADVDLTAGRLLALRTSGSSMTWDDWVTSGQKVMVHHEDRTIYNGRSTTTLGSDGNPVRHVPEPGLARTLLTGATAAVGLGSATFLLDGFTGAAAAAALIAWTALVLLSVHIALVDHDTMKIDLEAFALLGGVSWAAAITALLLSGRAGDLLYGGGAVVAIVLLFEVINRLFRWLRGHDGQGLGDTVLAVVLYGVPAALVGTAIVAYWTLMASSLLVLPVYVARRVMGTPHSRARIVPFAPYMAAGWWIALAGMETGATATVAGWLLQVPAAIALSL